MLLSAFKGLSRLYATDFLAPFHNYIVHLLHYYFRQYRIEMYDMDLPLIAQNP